MIKSKYYHEFYKAKTAIIATKYKATIPSAAIVTEIACGCWTVILENVSIHLIRFVSSEASCTGTDNFNKLL